MSNPNRSRRIRILFPMVLLITLAAFLLAGFSNVLATQSALFPSLFLPLILQASLPGAGTSTSTATVTPTQTSTPTPTAVVGAGKVSIVDFAFQPASITIHVGESVEWENTGAFNHTSTSDTGVWNSGALAPDQKFSFPFNSLGNYPYHCSLHPDMKGIIHVVPNP